MNKKLISLVKKNRQLFWDIGQKDLSQLNEEAIVERFMAYGDMQDIHDLKKILSGSTLNEVFKRLREKKRVNLEPETINFFDLYLS